MPGRGVPPYPLAARGKCALPCGGSLPLLHILAARWGSTRPGWVVPLPPLVARGKLVLMGERSPPFPLLVHACFKRTLVFRGYLLLVFLLRLATCKELTLTVPVLVSFSLTSETPVIIPLLIPQL